MSCHFISLEWKPSDFNWNFSAQVPIDDLIDASKLLIEALAMRWEYCTAAQHTFPSAATRFLRNYDKQNSTHLRTFLDEPIHDEKRSVHGKCLHSLTREEYFHFNLNDKKLMQSEWIEGSINHMKNVQSQGKMIKFLLLMGWRQGAGYPDADVKRTSNDHLPLQTAGYLPNKQPGRALFLSDSDREPTLYHSKAKESKKYPIHMACSLDQKKATDSQLMTGRYLSFYATTSRIEWILSLCVCLFHFTNHRPFSSVRRLKAVWNGDDAEHDIVALLYEK